MWLGLVLGVWATLALWLVYALIKAATGLGEDFNDIGPDDDDEYLEWVESLKGDGDGQRGD